MAQIPENSMSSVIVLVLKPILSITSYFTMKPVPLIDADEFDSVLALLKK